MKPTQEMVEAEQRRVNALAVSHDLLDLASRPTCAGQPDEFFLDESIRLLMVGSHAGRIGL
jgi:hypothetical protein